MSLLERNHVSGASALLAFASLLDASRRFLPHRGGHLNRTLSSVVTSLHSEVEQSTLQGGTAPCLLAECASLEPTTSIVAQLLDEIPCENHSSVILTRDLSMADAVEPLVQLLADRIGTNPDESGAPANGASAAEENKSDVLLHLDGYMTTAAFAINRVSALVNLFCLLSERASGGAPAVYPSLLIGHDFLSRDPTKKRSVVAATNIIDSRGIDSTTVRMLTPNRPLPLDQFVAAVFQATSSLSEVSFHGPLLAHRLLNEEHTKVGQLREKAVTGVLYRGATLEATRRPRERALHALMLLRRHHARAKQAASSRTASTSATTLPKLLHSICPDEKLLHSLFDAQSFHALTASYDVMGVALAFFEVLESFPVLAACSSDGVQRCSDFLSDYNEEREYSGHDENDDDAADSNWLLSYCHYYAVAVMRFSPLFTSTSSVNAAEGRCVYDTKTKIETYLAYLKMQPPAEEQQKAEQELAVVEEQRVPPHTQHHHVPLPDYAAARAAAKGDLFRGNAVIDIGGVGTGGGGGSRASTSPARSRQVMTSPAARVTSPGKEVIYRSPAREQRFVSPTKSRGAPVYLNDTASARYESPQRRGTGRLDGGTPLPADAPHVVPRHNAASPQAKVESTAKHKLRAATTAARTRQHGDGDNFSIDAVEAELEDFRRMVYSGSGDRATSASLAASSYQQQHVVSAPKGGFKPKTTPLVPKAPQKTPASTPEHQQGERQQEGGGSGPVNRQLSEATSATSAVSKLQRSATKKRRYVASTAGAAGADGTGGTAEAFVSPNADTKRKRVVASAGDLRNDDNLESVDEVPESKNVKLLKLLQRVGRGLRGRVDAADLWLFAFIKQQRAKKSIFTPIRHGSAFFRDDRDRMDAEEERGVATFAAEVRPGDQNDDRERIRSQSAATRLDMTYDNAKQQEATGKRRAAGADGGTYRYSPDGGRSVRYERPSAATQSSHYDDDDGGVSAATARVVTPSLNVAQQRHFDASPMQTSVVSKRYTGGLGAFAGHNDSHSSSYQQRNRSERGPTLEFQSVDDGLRQAEEDLQQERLQRLDRQTRQATGHFGY